MSEEEKNLFNRSVACIVEKDVLRTDRANPYYRGDNNPNLKILRNILLNYAVYSKTGYTQVRFIWIVVRVFGRSYRYVHTVNNYQNY